MRSASSFRRAQRTFLASLALYAVNRAGNLPAFWSFNKTERIDAAVAKLSVPMKIVRSPEDGNPVIDENRGFPHALEKIAGFLGDALEEFGVGLGAVGAILTYGIKPALGHHHGAGSGAVLAGQGMEELGHDGGHRFFVLRGCLYA